MASVHDVAAAILERTGSITAMKLQKLVYYCQAWHLVWDEEPLFPEAIEAWANGPVVRELYTKHRGSFKVSSWQRWGDSSRLTESERETIDVVLSRYARLSAAALSELTHSEPPWANARVGLQPGERGEREIPIQQMSEYYESLI